MSLYINSTENNSVTYACGSKAVALSEIASVGIEIPDFLCIEYGYFQKYCLENHIMPLDEFYSCDHYCEEEIEKFNYQKDDLEFDSKLKEFALHEVMVRSSAVPARDTDYEQFPSMVSGIYDSYPATGVNEMKRSIINVWKSAYAEKAYKHWKLFDVKMEGMSVVIQRYIHPSISGVAHIKPKRVSINWMKGHLSDIVSGKYTGKSIESYISSEGECIIRGTESDILDIIRGGHEDAFDELSRTCYRIIQLKGKPQEVEWIYDNKCIWIVQTQDLID